LAVAYAPYEPVRSGHRAAGWQVELCGNAGSVPLVKRDAFLMTASRALAFCTLVLLAVATRGSDAADWTMAGLDAGSLYDLCAASEPECSSYVGGVVDTAMLNRFLFSEDRDQGFVGPGQIAFCLPSGGPDADPVEIFVDFLHARPEEAPFSAAEGVMRALSERYPCEIGAAE
jgi:hypothetical protein